MMGTRFESMTIARIRGTPGADDHSVVPKTAKGCEKQSTTFVGVVYTHS